MDFKDLPKAYESKDVEANIYKRWEESGYFNPDKLPERNQNGEPFCISMR
jgi:valyl-tRNA synthetase